MFSRSALLLLMMCLPVLGLQSDEERRNKAHKKLAAEIQEARVLLNDRQYAQAEKEFDKLIAHYSNSANTKNLDQAKLSPLLLELQLAKVSTLTGQKKVQEAATFAKSKRSAKATVEDDLLTAQAFLLERDKKGCEAALQSAVKKDKEAYMAWFMLGRLAQSNRDNKKAIEHYKTSIKYNEDFSESRFYLGQIYLRENNKQGVREHWNAYLKLIPRKGKRYKQVNDTLQKLGGA